jgi:hypothetical protein
MGQKQLASVNDLAQSEAENRCVIQIAGESRIDNRLVAQ